ncbi:hypothetical protein [Bartonella sp. CL100XZDX]|uniref:hypothetical protein n=1 Tax=Bartonella sp. CL100XZDX TaxID=3243515 RepID=UPI0035CEFABC
MRQRAICYHTEIASSRFWIFFQFTHYDDAKPKYHRNKEKYTDHYGLRHNKNYNIPATLPPSYLPHIANNKDFQTVPIYKQ